jgi:hypothetical protein
MNKLKTLGWIGFMLTVLAQLVLRLLHRETPTSLLVAELICVAVIVVTESLSWWRQHPRGQ